MAYFRKYINLFEAWTDNMTTYEMRFEWYNEFDSSYVISFESRNDAKIFEHLIDFRQANKFHDNMAPYYIVDTEFHSPIKVPTNFLKEYDVFFYINKEEIVELYGKYWYQDLINKVAPYMHEIYGPVDNNQEDY
jgi:hypothetical protein